MKLSVPMMRSGSFAVAVSLLCAGGAVAQQNNMSRIAKEVVQKHTQSVAKSPASNADVVSNGNGSSLSFASQSSYDEQIKKAQEYVKQGNFDLALQEYDKIIAVNPNIASLYIMRGDIHVAKSNFEQAIQEYSKAIVLDQNNHHNQEGKGNQDYYERRGMIYFTVGDLEHAMQDYNKMIAINPNNGSAYYSRGMVHAMGMDYQQAMEDYKKACRLGHAESCSMMKGR